MASTIDLRSSFHSSEFMALAHPQVIFLDAVGTLLGLRQSVGEVYSTFAANAGVTVDPHQLNQAFVTAFRAAPPCTFPGSSPQVLGEQEYHWWKNVAAHSFAIADALDHLPEFDLFFQPLFAHYASADPWVLYSDVLPALHHWHRTGISLAVVSNFDSRLHSVLNALGLENFFSSLTLSSQVGAAKPDVRIFQAALEHYSIPPDQAWHIGDSWRDDVQGAIASGIQPIWLNREKPLFQEQPQPERRPVPVIASLTELVIGHRE